MMRLTPAVRWCAVLVAIPVFLAGCAGDPDPVPVPPAPVVATPPPAPEPAPPPQPEGHAPLVGTRWTLTRLYGDMRRLVPPSRDVWIEFRPPEDGEASGNAGAATAGEGAIFVQGPENTIDGRYLFRVHTDATRTGPEYEEGTLTGSSVVRNRRAGSFSEFEDMLLENLVLLKGYYIEGERPAESVLTIWGGYRSEEVILMELAATPIER